MRLTNKTLNLVDTLTLSAPAIVSKDDGPRVAYRDGLLQQLRAAVLSGLEGTGGGSAFEAKLPIDTGAADLLDELSSIAAQALAAVSKQPTPYGFAEDHVRAFAELATEETTIELQYPETLPKALRDRRDPATGLYRPNVVQRLRTVKTNALLADMVERIEAFFNPKSIREIPLPCPVCGARHVDRMRDGDVIPYNALNIHRDPNTMQAVEARCENCRARWTAGQFAFLAKLLGLDLPADLEALALPDHTIEIVDGAASFQCTAPEDAACHWWPDCDCDWWPDPEEHERRHPSVQHDTCTMSEWFSSLIIRDCWSHPDGLPMPTEHERAGFELEWEEIPLWWFTDIETPEEAA